VRNDSMSRRIYLGCTGQRWCQENATHLSEWMPVVANRFVGPDLSMVRCSLRLPVRAASERAPDGYAAAPVLATRGTIYPGVIDRHNHGSPPGLVGGKIEQITP